MFLKEKAELMNVNLIPGYTMNLKAGNLAREDSRWLNATINMYLRGSLANFKLFLNKNTKS